MGNLGKLAGVAILSCGALSVAYAQQQSCAEVAYIARMASARSMHALVAAKQKAGDSYRSQVIFASSVFELNPKDKEAATRLLDLIPRDDAQQGVLTTLGDSQCDSESILQMKALARRGEGLPRDLARAVLLVPDKMQAYVSYAMTAVQDPHSDYAVQMRRVCQARSLSFKRAVGQLPTDKKEWFEQHILILQGCQVLTLPEAE